MKSKLNRIDKLPIVLISFIVIGILSSFFDFGIISVFFSVMMPLIFIANFILGFYAIFKKKYFYLIGVLLFLFSYQFFIQVSKASQSPKDHISILTYNVRDFEYFVSNNAEHDASPEIIKFVDSINADILVFQESPKAAWRKIKGYPYTFLSYREDIDKSLQIIYSKYPIINKGYIDFPDTRNNAIYADIKIKQDTIRVYNSHLQSFSVNKYILNNNYKNINYWKHLNNTNAKQIEQAEQLKTHSNKFDKQVIICGDFNSTPYSQTYRVLKEGMNDSFFSNGNGFGKTFSILKIPLRLDYFLYNNQIDVISHENFTLNLSDHEPILVKFKIKNSMSSYFCLENSLFLLR